MKKKVYKFIVNFEEKKTKRMLLVLLAVFTIAFALIFQLACEEIKKCGNNDNLNPVDPELEREITEMVKGYPIESMVPFIAQKDKAVAAFLVSIAKKESSWGEHAPVKNGKDCYNYWGFRMDSDTMGSGGHTCFKNPRQAVNSVSSRIFELINEEKLNSPRKMVVWKCGYDCSGQSSYDVNKWISDVSFYKKLIN